MIPAMIHASLDFVGVVTQPPERKEDYRFFGVSVVGKDKSGFKYETFSVACVLPPGDLPMLLAIYITPPPSSLLHHDS